MRIPAAFKSHWLIAALAFASQSVFAHPGHEQSFNAGVQHPISGLDHILAMAAVGLWAFQLGGRARWALPVVFLAGMALGGALGIVGPKLPIMEYGIAASLLLLGLVLAAGVKPSLQMGSALVAVCALFHGYAHGMEMPQNGSVLPFAGGFMLTTAVLHSMGFLVGVMIGRLQEARALRIVGGAITCCGILLISHWL